MYLWEGKGRTGTEDFKVNFRISACSTPIPITAISNEFGDGVISPVIGAKFCSNQPKEIKPQEKSISAPS